MSERRLMSLIDLVADAGTQSRAGIDKATVEEYAAAICGGEELPDIEAVSDGETVWVWDGFHRLMAYKQAGVKEAWVNVQAGTLAGARWLACSANRKHGLKRTSADKRRAVEMALAIRPNLSDPAIAEHCGVDHTTVAKARVRLGNPQPETRIGRDGKRYPARKKGGRKKPQGNGKTVTQAEGEEVLNGHADAAVSPPATEEENEAVRAAAPVLDAWGVPIQPHAAEAFEAVPRFGELAKLIRQAQKLFNEVANLPGGKFLTLPDVSSYRRGRKTEGGDHADRFVHPGLETALKQVLAAVPAHTVCPWNYADAPHPDDCPTCKGLNWTPELSRNVPPSVIGRVKESFGVAEEVVVV